MLFSSCFPSQTNKPYIALLFNCSGFLLPDLLKKHETKGEKSIRIAYVPREPSAELEALEQGWRGAVGGFAWHGNA